MYADSFAIKSCLAVLFSPFSFALEKPDKEREEKKKLYVRPVTQLQDTNEAGYPQINDNALAYMYSYMVTLTYMLSAPHFSVSLYIYMGFLLFRCLF